MVSISNGTLVFHAEVRGFDEFVAIAPERVFAEIFFVAGEHGFDLLELDFGFFYIFR